VVQTNASGEGGRQFAVEGMSCEGCALGLKAKLAKLPEVRSVEVSFEEKQVTVVADESRLSTADIEAAIQKAGYEGKLVAAK
jgi:copper chaperone CopZ